MSEASLLTSVPVFPPQEVAAGAADVAPVLRRVCQEDALSDELRLRELCDGQCWVERRGYEHARVHGRPFISAVHRVDVPDSQAVIDGPNAGP